MLVKRDVVHVKGCEKTDYRAECLCTSFFVGRKERSVMLIQTRLKRYCRFVVHNEPSNVGRKCRIIHRNMSTSLVTLVRLKELVMSCEGALD